MIDAATAAYVLLLGMVAAFNPCGFALLPAYVTMLVTGTAQEKIPTPVALRRAITFGSAMTVGFFVVFLGFGILFGQVNRALQGDILPVMPYVTVVLGLLLVVLGFIVAMTGELRAPGMRVRTTAPSRRWFSQVMYGAGFGLASLTCTIHFFLFVVLEAFRATNPLGATVPFVIYGAGMGAVVIAVSIIAALFGSSVVAGLRSRTPQLMRAGGVIMVLAGLYVTLFGLAEVLPRWGVNVLDPVLDTTLRWQSSVVTAVSSWGTPVLIALIILVVAAVASILVWEKRTDYVTPTEDSRPPAGFAVADSGTLGSITQATSVRKRERPPGP